MMSNAAWFLQTQEHQSPQSGSGLRSVRKKADATRSSATIVLNLLGRPMTGVMNLTEGKMLCPAIELKSALN
jgi:hypothetical protein